MKLLKKIGLMVVMSITLGLGNMIAIQCPLKCLPIGFILIAAGLYLVEYYATNWSKFND